MEQRKTTNEQTNVVINSSLRSIKINVRKNDSSNELAKK